MDIFISWSGARSLAVAEALRDWLPMIINAAKPFLSVADIDKGARWSSEIATKLEKAKAGIICLTPGNVGSHWILFEAGALSKTVQNTYVCPLLIGLRPADVRGPLAQFQLTTASKADVLKLVKTLNAALGEGALLTTQIERVFEIMWPQLDEALKKAPPEETKIIPERSEREMLEEALELLRNFSRPFQLETRGRTIGEIFPPSKRQFMKMIRDRIVKKVLEPSGDAVALFSLEHAGANRYVLEIETRGGFGWREEFVADPPYPAVADGITERFAARYRGPVPVEF